ncbi:MAG: NYN domain-containing protein [Patescibacteria group bacterium]
MNNFAFIDAHNVYRATKSAGWQLDWAKLYTYLRDKYKIKRTYIFLGYLPENEDLYRRLKKIGYELIFKEAISVNGKIKANVDAELVLQSMIDYPEYDQALLLSNDGDFACLVRYLLGKSKFMLVLSPDYRFCSLLLKKAFNKRIPSLSDLREKLEYKK